MRLLVEDGGQTGRAFSQPDLIIAATALLHTRDGSDLEKARSSGWLAGPPACAVIGTAMVAPRVRARGFRR